MKVLALLSCLLLASTAHSGETAQQDLDIVNFRQYTPTFASSGQIQQQHLQQLQAQGFNRIVYIAYRTHGGDADKLTIDKDATDLGFQYVHIPVPWQSPSLSHYQTFAAVMKSQPSTKTLLHCQMNYRASAFSFLYRVLELKTPVEEALADLKSIWKLDNTWLTFINEVLAAHSQPPIPPSQIG